MYDHEQGKAGPKAAQDVGTDRSAARPNLRGMTYDDQVVALTPVQMKAAGQGGSGGVTAKGGDEDPLLTQGVAALDAGKTSSHFFTLDLEGDAVMLVFDDQDVHRLQHHLFDVLLGRSADDSLVRSESSAVTPPWVAVLRLAALRGLEGGPNPTAKAARRLCAVVEREPPKDPNEDADRMTDIEKKIVGEGLRRMGSIDHGKQQEGTVDLSHLGMGEQKKENLFYGAAKQEDGTSCGLLPGASMRTAGLKGPATLWATTGLVKHRLFHRCTSPTDLPRPGDAFALEEGQHVGIIHRIDIETDQGLVWETLDSGQKVGGTYEAAHVVRRRVTRVADGIVMSALNATATSGDTAGSRRLTGWLPVEALAESQGKGSKKGSKKGG